MKKGRNFLGILCTLFCTVCLLNVSAALPSPDSIGVKKRGDKYFIVYQIKQGETLYSIAKHYNSSVPELLDLNNKTSIDLNINEVILIPGTTAKFRYKVANSVTGLMYHEVKVGETLASISKKYGVHQDSIIARSKLTNSKLEPGMFLVIEGKVRSIHVEDTNETKPNLSHHQFVQSSGDRFTEEGFAKVSLDLKVYDKYSCFHRSLALGSVLRLEHQFKKEVYFLKVVGELEEPDPEIVVAIHPSFLQQFKNSGSYIPVVLKYDESNVEK